MGKSSHTIVLHRRGCDGMGCSTSVLEYLVDLSSLVVVADARCGAVQNVVLLSLRLKRLWNVQTESLRGGLQGLFSARFGRLKDAN
jgi:hypothetical protein